MYSLICLIPIAFFAGFTVTLYTRKRRDREKYLPAFKDSLLRPPGEGLRQRIALLDDEINEQLTAVLANCAMALIAFIFLSFFQRTLFSFTVSIGVALVTLPSVIINCKRLYQTTAQRKRYAIGFEGERMAGEHLSLLMLKGYRAYHDIEFDGYNVDHLVVGPGGVFAVETKTRRKLVAEGRMRATVRFDGKLLHYPGSSEDHGLEQAKLNARQVASWLSQAVGEAIKVRAILCLPGWNVQTDRIWEHIDVVNPKSVVRVLERLERTKPLLPEKLQKQICYQVEQKNGMLPTMGAPSEENSSLKQMAMFSRRK